MDEANEAVERAREALAGITPGKWYHQITHTKRNYVFANEKNNPIVCQTAIGLTRGNADAQFIAVAPQLVRDLLAAVDAAAARAEAAEREAQEAREALKPFAALVWAWNAQNDDRSPYADFAEWLTDMYQSGSLYDMNIPLHPVLMKIAGFFPPIDAE